MLNTTHSGEPSTTTDPFPGTTTETSGANPAPRSTGVADSDPRAWDPEVEARRLQELVGTDEYSYVALKLELWSVRDIVIGMEAELGNLRGRCLTLERDLEARGRSLAQLERTRTETVLPVVTGMTAALRRRARNLRPRRR